jgi:quinol monooxygenase YgiN
MAALEEHRKGEQYQAMLVRAREEKLLAGPPDIKILQPVGGFGLRA